MWRDALKRDWGKHSAWDNDMIALCSFKMRMKPFYFGLKRQQKILRMKLLPGEKKLARFRMRTRAWYASFHLIFLSPLASSSLQLSNIDRVIHSIINNSWVNATNDDFAACYVRSCCLNPDPYKWLNPNNVVMLMIAVLLLLVVSSFITSFSRIN